LSLKSRLIRNHQNVICNTKIVQNTVLIISTNNQSPNSRPAEVTRSFVID
jgi:hypothetical protein